MGQEVSRQGCDFRVLVVLQTFKSLRHIVVVELVHQELHVVLAFSWSTQHQGENLQCFELEVDTVIIFELQLKLKQILGG